MKRAFFIRLTALTGALCLLLSACGGSNQGGTDATLYFEAANASSGAAVRPETRTFDHSDITPAELVQALLDGPQDSGLTAPFPQGTLLRSCTVNPDTKTASVDFSEPYGGLSGVDLTIADSCVTLTLCQLPQVEAVSVTVDGQSLPFHDRALRTGDLVLSGAEGEPVQVTVQLYYLRGSGLAKEEREVLITESETSVSAVLNALLDGPKEKDHRLPLPDGTELISAAVENGVCYVNFSAPFRDNAPKGREAALLLYAIVDTLCALDSVNSVHLLVEGESLASYGGVPANAPLEADLTLVQS